MINIFHQDSQAFLEAQKVMYDLIYIDPPYNTRKTQKLGENSYDDSIADYKAFMLNHIFWAHKLLKPTGTMIVQCDWHEAHHIRTWMDTCFGSECFLNEIIWAYDYGARSKKKWSTKHDNIFIYVKDPVPVVDQQILLMAEIVGQEKLPHPLRQAEGVRGDGPDQIVAALQGDAGGDGVAVPGEHHPGGLPEPVIQTDVLLGAVAVVAKGVAADIELRPAVALQKAGHAAAVVIMPVGEDRVIRSF